MVVMKRDILEVKLKNSSKKWLCVGGSLEGTWYFYYCDYFYTDWCNLNSDKYIKKWTKNPVTGLEEYFYIWARLSKQVYSRAILKAIKISRIKEKED
ncbi:hypothetical protein EXD98_15110 [Acinetobacter pittii]|uniref:Uncharacterized protein n=1 Tax=Acinetobacter pittii TaxID=48296 RepID=A0AAE8GA76_ACIPI|nr:hypothetical protein [Acinetobacter pittii]MDO7492186.1 hypothetical protein [Acinetobacter baumannii]RZH26515.1 hypothetical protein EXD98_15110 [Acinetobacter pittii]